MLKLYSMHNQRNELDMYILDDDIKYMYHNFRWKGKYICVLYQMNNEPYPGKYTAIQSTNIMSRETQPKVKICSSFHSIISVKLSISYSDKDRKQKHFQHQYLWPITQDPVIFSSNKGSMLVQHFILNIWLIVPELNSIFQMFDCLKRNMMKYITGITIPTLFRFLKESLCFLVHSK